MNRSPESRGSQTSGVLPVLFVQAKRIKPFPCRELRGFPNLEAAHPNNTLPRTKLNPFETFRFAESLSLSGRHTPCAFFAAPRPLFRRPCRLFGLPAATLFAACGGYLWRQSRRQSDFAAQAKSLSHTMLISQTVDRRRNAAAALDKRRTRISV